MTLTSSSLAQTSARRDGKTGSPANECVFITCTRVTPKKSLERVVDGISSYEPMGTSIGYVIVGFLGDAYESKLTGDTSGDSPTPAIFRCNPFVDHA